MRLIDADALCAFFEERYKYLRSASETRLSDGRVYINQTIQTGAIIAKEFLDNAKAAPTIEVKQDPPFSEQELEDLICGCDAHIQEFCVSKAEVEPFENLIHKLERMIGDLHGTGKKL